MIEYIADRVFANWKTTIISLAAFGVISYLGVTKAVEWDTLSGWFASAFMFLFVKDPKSAPAAE